MSIRKPAPIAAGEQRVAAHCVVEGRAGDRSPHDPTAAVQGSSTHVPASKNDSA